MRTLRDSFSSFRQGLRAKLLWGYLLAFKDRAWEIFWGASLVGIIFGIYTIFHAPSKVLLLSYLLLVVFMAGYYLWQVDHVRVMPRLKVTGYKIEPTATADGSETRTYVQLCPRCATDVPVRNCQGHLLRVHTWDGTAKEWKLTAIDEAVDLEWSIYGFGARTIQPGAEPRLNICFIALSTQRKRLRTIVPTVSATLLSWASVFDNDGTFRFDIRITAEDCAPVNAFMTVSMDPGRASKEPTVNLL
jgi:hypothetical protein